MSGTVVVTIDPRAEGDPLRRELEAAGFEPHRNPNARWAFRGPGVVLSFYASGKLVAQGFRVWIFGSAADSEAPAACAEATAAFADVMACG